MRLLPFFIFIWLSCPAQDLPDHPFRMINVTWGASVDDCAKALGKIRPYSTFQDGEDWYDVVIGPDNTVLIDGEAIFGIYYLGFEENRLNRIGLRTAYTGLQGGVLEELPDYTDFTSVACEYFLDCRLIELETECDSAKVSTQVLPEYTTTIQYYRSNCYVIDILSELKN